jgi:hypothetical protein
MRRIALRLPLLCLAIFVALICTGCATRTETVDVSVRNDAAQPVTVWLTKIGGPEQEGWRSPESIAINFVVGEEPIGGVIVPPKSTARTGKRSGKFDRESYPVLRVYRGEMKLSEMLANGKDSPNRADVVLEPGVNRFVVTDPAGKLTVDRADTLPAAAPAK